MRFFYRPGTVIATITAAFMLNTPYALAQVSNAELLEKLDSMQQQIDELRRQLAEAQEKTTETDARVEAVAEAIESAPPQAAKASKTTIGGYGELHYNNLDADDPSRDVEMLDLHRFVLFFGHEFNDRTRFYSEVEVEHALVAGEDDAPGEVEIEQAYVEFDLRKDLYAKAGVFLIPVGILNETHEPTTFYGVERNDVESVIVPSTWWEGGAGLTGRFGSGWNWDLAYTSGLAIATTGSDAFRVRSGRQKVAEAHASDGAITGRLRYVGIPGLQAALTVQYQIDPSQVPNDGLDSGTLVEAHIDYQRNGFGLRALYARWDFTGEAVEAAGADRQTGWYIEPSYRLNDQIGFYTRYENVDAARASDKFDQWELGLNWWPTENVVIKFDYRDRSHDLGSESGRNFTGFDIGFGYAF
jgi:opacity protein-like surface antigen